MDYLNEIRNHITALTPLIYVGTHSPEVIREELEAVASSLGMNFHCIFLADTGVDGDDPLQTMDKIIDTNRKNGSDKKSFWLLYYYHLLLKDPDPLIIAKLRQLLDTKTLNSIVVVLGTPYFNLPPELSDVFRIDSTTISRTRVTETIISSGENYTEEEIEALTRGLTGIQSQNELETLLALSLVTSGNGRFDPDYITLEKKRLIQSRGNGLFGITETEFGLEYIGGMEELVKWTRLRVPLLKGKTMDHPNLTRPKGVLLIGVPGGGKSFFASAVGKTYNLPVVKLDPYRLFHSSLGGTESNFLHVLESLRLFCSPVIFFIDEIEKSFSLTDGNTDGNTSNRMLSALLDFLSNHDEPVFTIATCNSIDLLPPELLRKGRFDEIFYISFPNVNERRAICEALCRKYRLSTKITDLLVNILDGFTGSEIEQVFRDALYEALGRNARGEISEFQLILQAKKMVPIKITMRDELDSLERWAAKRCRRASCNNHN